MLEFPGSFLSSCHAFDLALSTLQTAQGSLRLPEAQGPDARENALFDPPPVDFVFRRFLAYMALSMTFRANPGTTRPPALALASTSRTERVGREKKIRQ